MPKVYRHQRVAYIKLDTEYVLIGEGVTDWTTSTNPKTTSSHYVHQQNASGGVSGYAPSIAVTAEGYNGDPFMDYLMDLGRTLSVGAEVQKKLCIVDLWTGTGATDRKAVEVDIVITIDNPGTGAAGEALAVNATLTFNGDPKQGTFDTGLKKFTATV